MSRITTVAVLVTSLLAASCGYIRSGKWEDDPDNWGRAFHSGKPQDVVVVHSEYWRSPHWSYEAGYLFELEPNAVLRRQLFSENRLRKLEGSELAIDPRPCFKCPEWFAPKSLDSYEIWTYEGDPRNFRILIDKSTGHIYLGDYQI